MANIAISSSPVYEVSDTSSDYWHMIEQTITGNQLVLNDALGLTAQVRLFDTASEKSGGAVIINPLYGCLPILLGSDGEPVPVYELVEEWDALTDYDDLQERFPTLSYMQIAGAVAFIRKLAQFNAKRQDIDDLISRQIEGDTDFQDAIRNALTDRGIARVLAANE